MITFLVRRFLLAIVTIWLISVLSFTIIQLPPGDFVDTYIAQMAASGSQVFRRGGTGDARDCTGWTGPSMSSTASGSRASSRAISASRWSGAARSPR